jgi:hypothetical protein
MVSIDGTEISGATIDGTEVQEITMGGDVVWTNEFSPGTEPTINNTNTVWADWNYNSDENANEYFISTADLSNNLAHQQSTGTGGYFGPLQQNTVDEDGLYFKDNDTIKVYDENLNIVRTVNNIPEFRQTVGYKRLWGLDVDTNDIVGRDKYTGEEKIRWSVGANVNKVFYNKGESLIVTKGDTFDPQNIYEYDFQGNQLNFVDTGSSGPENIYHFASDKKFYANTANDNGYGIYDIDSGSYDWRVNSGVGFGNGATELSSGETVWWFQDSNAGVYQLELRDKSDGSLIDTYDRASDQQINEFSAFNGGFLAIDFEGNATVVEFDNSLNFQNRWQPNQDTNLDDTRGVYFLPNEGAYPNVY